MSQIFKISIALLLLLILNLQNTSSTTLTNVLIPDSTITADEVSFTPFLSPVRLAREIKYPRYATDNTDKNLKPDESGDRDNTNSQPGKRCISCFSSYPSYSTYPVYERPRNYYDDYRSRDRDYDRYDDRDRYYDRDRYDRDRYYDRYDRDRYYRGRDRYGDRDRNYDPYDYDRYDSYDRYDRYGDRYDRYDRDRYDRYSDRGVGYDNRGYDYRSDPYKSNDDHYRGYSSGRPDYGTSGYASKWNYGSSGVGRDDSNRDRYSNYRPVSKDPYNDTYRPTSYLYARPSSTTLKPPTDDSNTQSPQENSG